MYLLCGRGHRSQEKTLVPTAGPRRVPGVRNIRLLPSVSKEQWLATEKGEGQAPCSPARPQGRGAGCRPATQHRLANCRREATALDRDTGP